MYRGSPSPSESPPFDVPDFPRFRRVKPLPKRRRTSGAGMGMGGIPGGGLLVSEENLSATVSAIFDEHQRQRQRLQAQGILPPSAPPTHSSALNAKLNTSSASGSLSDFTASIANAATDPKMSNQELEDILLAHADNLSTRMTMQNYYMPSLGGVRGFLSSAAAAAAGTSSSEVDNWKAGGPTRQGKLPAPPPLSSFSELKDLDLSLDIDLDSIEEFGARFAAAAAAAGAAIDEFSLVQERFMPNGKGRPIANLNSSLNTSTGRAWEKNRDRGGDDEDAKDEEDEPRHRQEGQGNTKKRKVPAEGILRDRDRDRERDRESEEEEDDDGADEQEHPDVDNTSSPSTPLRLNSHSHHEQSQFGAHHGGHSYAPAPYPGLLAHVRRRRGKLTAAALAGVQQKEMLRRRRRQLAAFVGGLAGSGQSEGVSYSWSGAGGLMAGGTIGKGNATEGPNEAGRGDEGRDDIGYGMSLAFEQALMQMRIGPGSGKPADDASNESSSSFGFWTSSTAAPPSANFTSPGGSGNIFSNAAGIGVDMEVESQLLFESVTGLGLPGGLGGLAGSHSVQGGSITFDFGSASNLGDSLPPHLPPGILNALHSSSSSSNPSLPFPMSMQQPAPSVRKSKRRTVRLARTMKVMLEMPAKKTPHPDAVAFPKKDVFEFKWPSGTADRLSATKEEVLALRRRFEMELERQKKKTKRLALVAAAAAAGTGAGTGARGAGGEKQLLVPTSDKEKEREKVVATKAKREREHVPSNASAIANSGGTKTSTSPKNVTQSAPSTTGTASEAGVTVSSTVQSQDQVAGQTKGKKKKKKRSALANASNPHHLKNYVPSRLPSTGTSGSAAPGATGDYWGISPLPVRFLSSDIPPRTKGRGKKGIRQDKEKENQTPNAQVQTHPPEDEWICAFCEYDLFYGGQAGYNRAVKARKKVLKRRRRAKERAAGLGTAKGKAVAPSAPAEKFEPGDEDSGDEEQSEEDVDGNRVGQPQQQQQQGNGLRAGRWKEEG